MRDKKRSQSLGAVKKMFGLSGPKSNKYEASRRVGMAISQLETNEIKQFTLYIPFEERIKRNPNLKNVLASK
jgi:hypothetical protein